MIEAKGLLKYYGSRRALAGVSLEIDRGEAVGVLGLNGVGKTTLLRILATDLRPTSGSVLVDGVDAVRNEVPGAFRQLFVTDPNGLRVELNLPL